MLDAISAELLKLRWHRATWLMVWIFPLAIALVLALAFAYHAIAGPGAPSPDKGAAAWLRDSAIMLRYAQSGGGRCLAAGYAALVFAGEYGWNTWKLVIPARARWQLIVAKLTVTVAFLLAATVAADLINLAATWIDTLQGAAVPAGVTVGDIVAAHERGLGFAVVPILYTVAFAALFAITTQSLLAAVILSIAMVIAEGLLPLAAIFCYSRAPGLVLAAVELLPFYHMLNVGAWARGVGLSLQMAPGTTVAMSLAQSLAVLLAWTAGAGALMLVRFVRQDVN